MICNKTAKSNTPFKTLSKTLSSKNNKFATAFCCALFSTIAPSSLLSSAQAASGASTNQSILMIEMSTAECKLNYFSMSKTRQCTDKHAISVKGMDIGYTKSCSGNANLRLPPLQKKVVTRYIPDPNVQKQIWAEYGKCSPLTSTEYFHKLTNHAKQLKLPKELSAGNNYTVTKSRFMQQLLSINTGMKPDNLDLICSKNGKNQSVLTEIDVCYANQGKYSDCPKKVDNCPSSFIIYGR